jgi:hypothetical protein
MYAYIHEFGRGFFEGCAGRRIGQLLFATHPSIRELTLGDTPWLPHR